MRFLCLSLAVTGLALSGVLSDDVLEFTDANFESKIQDLDVALVEFYAPW